MNSCELSPLPSSGLVDSMWSAVAVDAHIKYLIWISVPIGQYHKWWPVLYILGMKWACKPRTTKCFPLLFDVSDHYSLWDTYSKHKMCCTFPCLNLHFGWNWKIPFFVQNKEWKGVTILRENDGSISRLVTAVTTDFKLWSTYIPWRKFYGKGWLWKKSVAYSDRKIKISLCMHAACEYHNHFCNAPLIAL